LVKALLLLKGDMAKKELAGYFANIWIIKNPYIFYRVIRGFYRAILRKTNTLKTIEIFPTMECNLRCPMCSIKKYQDNTYPVLNLKDYKQLATQGAKMGAVALTILGGEPFLFEGLAEIIRIFKKEHFFIYMVSNGTLVTREKLQRLIEAGLDSICFSLDSMSEEESDRVRGFNGYFRNIFKAVEMAKEENLIVNLAPVFFPGRLNDSIEVIKYCQKNSLGASGGQVAAVGGWEGAEILSKAEHDAIRALLRDYPRLTFDWALSYFLKMRCPAGKEKIAVSAHGDVVGCSVNPISFGNIMQEPLSKIWERMGVFSQFKKDSPVCLAAEDREYVHKYLKTLINLKSYPIFYKSHPAINADTEPELFAK
jgi:MoaA/NifB/PqqE/SkfB family radical SAM enzyme